VSRPYGMLCPVAPNMLGGDGLERLIDAVRPDRIEHLWAEPYNDRFNWQQVREGYQPGSAGYRWLTETFEGKDRSRWSRYATELYLRLRDKAEAEGWIGKLKYLLYEDGITAEDAKVFRGLYGVLVQSKPGADGLSTNRHIAELQKKRRKTKA